MTVPVKGPKKLIEVALPLDEINAASKREKSIRHGHPSTLHLWWARRPLAAARAVLFAQLVNDPGYVADGVVLAGPARKPAGTMPAKTRFYGCASIDPISAKIEFNEIVDEVAAQFTSRPGIAVTIRIEISAEDQGGFDERLRPRRSGRGRGRSGT